MIGVLTRSAAVVALVILAGGLSPVRADHGGEDERPDLQIELLGLPLASGQRELQIQVTNVSEWWANETKLRVETVAPTPGNVEELDVENLDPGQSVTLTYTLAGACDRHVVKAEVAAAENYEGVPEGNLGNNRVQREVCPARAQGAPKPEAPAPSGPIPEHLRPGWHTAGGQYPPLTFKPSAVKSVWRNSNGLVLPSEPSVGWQKFETDFFDNPFGWGVGQTAVNFDLSQLDEVPNPGILKALLTFDETPWVWRHADGTPKLVNSCVSVLGIATDDWAAQPSLPPQFPNRREWDAVGGKKEWDVTSHVRDQMLDRGNRALRYGYVLRGALDFEDVRSDDKDSCLSKISNLHLTISYDVPR